jgi:xanthine dehydrogenase molybdopterin-binding subunit B
MFTKGPGAYKIPGFRDIPQVFNVALLKDVQWENLRTIQRSRGVGMLCSLPSLHSIISFFFGNGGSEADDDDV